MSPVLEIVSMKKLKIILQSKWFILFFIIITIIATAIKLLIPANLYYTEKDNVLIGNIEKITIGNNKISLIIQAKEKIQGTYYFTNAKEKHRLGIGDRVKIIGKLTKPKKPTTQGLFCYACYLHKQGIYHTMRISTIQKLKSTTKILDKIKNTLNEKITHPYMQSFLLGNSDNIDETVKNSYQENGISHLFAISGMQFYLIANFILKINKRLKISKKANSLLTCFIIFIYFSILDLNASILRGMLFFCLFSINKIGNLNMPKWKIVTLAILITILINPYFITEVAFWYSFTISIGLLYFLQPSSYWRSLWNSSMISFLLSIPISLYYFCQINLLSLFYNLFYIPYINIIIFPLTIVTLLIPPVEPLYQLTINILEESSLLLNNIKIGKFIFPKTSVLIYLVEAIILIICLKNKQKKFFIILITVFIVHYGLVYFKQDFMKVIDVGQGDSILIFSKGEAALIDTGGKLSFEQTQFNTITKYTTIPLLKSLGIKKIKFLFLTHGDMDHMGEALYFSNNFTVDNIYINLGGISALENKLLTSRKTKISSQNSVFQVGNFTIYQLNKSWKEENNSSSVYYIYHPKLTILLMGDATVETEKYLVDNYNLNIDILKVGHHGSKTSTGTEFLKTTSPKLALISVGENNNFNHPSKQVLDNLENFNIPYLMTKDSGTITIFPKTKEVVEDKKQ